MGVLTSGLEDYGQVRLWSILKAGFSLLLVTKAIFFITLWHRLKKKAEAIFVWNLKLSSSFKNVSIFEMVTFAVLRVHFITWVPLKVGGLSLPLALLMDSNGGPCVPTEGCKAPHIYCLKIESQDV